MIYGNINIEHSRFKSRTEAKAPLTTTNIINTLALILCCTAFTLSLYELFFSSESAFQGLASISSIIGYVALICGSVILLFYAKKLLNFIFCLAIFVASKFVFGSPVISKILILFALSIALCAFMTASAKKTSVPYLVIAPVAAYLAALSICKNPGFCAIILIPYVIGLLMGLMTKKKCSASEVIATASAIIVAVICITMSVAMTVSGISLSALADLLRTRLILAIESLFNEAYPQFIANMTAVGYDTAFANSIFNEIIGEVAPTVITIVNMLPGIIIFAITVLIFISRNTQMSLLENQGYTEYVTPDTMLLNMSIISAVVFIVAAVFSVSTDAAGIPDIVSVVSTNVMLITMPGLIYTGVISTIACLINLLKRKRLFSVILIVGLAVILIYAMLPYILQIIAFVGALFIIVRSSKEFAAKNIGKGDA